MISKSKLFLLAFFSIVFSNLAFSQELNCQLSVQTPKIEGSDKSIYDKLQTDLREFMNNHHWTNDEFLVQEKIECTILITINEKLSNEDFSASINVTSRRPVYHSSYNTPMFNHKDENFTFRYVQDQQIEFDEGNITSNLTAVLGYYAYIIIGLDYDSYSPLGGTPYFIKAQTVSNNAQNLADRGWKPFEGDKNRYWLIENLLNVSFRPFRDMLYTYHRQGLDKFAENIEQARPVMSESIRSLRKVHQDKPGSFLLNIFFTTKKDEIVNIYTGATPSEKSDLIPILSQIDPARALEYSNIANGGGPGTGGK